MKLEHESQPPVSERRALGIRQRIDALDPNPKRILITGSLYLAGHVLALQEGVEPQAN